ELANFSRRVRAGSDRLPNAVASEIQAETLFPAARPSKANSWPVDRSERHQEKRGLFRKTVAAFLWPSNTAGVGGPNGQKRVSRSKAQRQHGQDRSARHCARTRGAESAPPNGVSIQITSSRPTRYTRHRSASSSDDLSNPRMLLA